MVPRPRRWLSGHVGGEHLVLPSPTAGGWEASRGGDPLAAVLDSATRTPGSDDGGSCAPSTADVDFAYCQPTRRR